MLRKMTTFSYLTHNIKGAFDVISKNDGNTLLGGFSSAVIEFLGRCITDPKSTDARKNFYKFIDEYLRKKDPRYTNFRKILYEDFRCGSAHSIMPKGVRLSFHGLAKQLHLELIKDRGRNSYHVFLYSPKFIEDLKESIDDFVRDAKKDKELEQKYIETISELEKESQIIINNSNLPLSEAIEIRLSRTIKF